ncbi:MAG: AraC family ligand binding domain-containing protein, partial [Coprobacillaceae bacterium]
MLEQNLLEKIVYFTEEEINNLNGNNKIDKSIFLNENSNIVDHRKLLAEGSHLSVRKHARFCQYPSHRHNYIELMYVYAGEMTHIIDDKIIVLNEGEMLLLNQNIEHSIKYSTENDIIFNFIIKPEFLNYLSKMLKEENELTKFIFEALY